MRTIDSYDDALDFLPRAETAMGSRSFFAKVGVVIESMREGAAAARRYQELTGRGVPHDKAAERVFAEVFAAS